MKNGIYTFLFLLCFLSGFSQAAKYRLPERRNPTVTKEKLNSAQYINDISPLLWDNLSMEMSQRYFLDKRRPEILPQPGNYVYPQENYKQIVDVVFVEITATRNGIAVKAKSKSDKLTTEQQNLLRNADEGANVYVALNYKYKNQTIDSYGPRNLVINAEAMVLVVPAMEAEFPGGHKQLSEYFMGNVISKVAEKDIAPKVERAAVKFVVNEDGKVTDAKISRSSSDAHIDQLLLEAVNKMPIWKPAVDSKGVKVKQVISIPFGMDGC